MPYTSGPKLRGMHTWRLPDLNEDVALEQQFIRFGATCAAVKAQASGVAAEEPVPPKLSGAGGHDRQEHC